MRLETLGNAWKRLERGGCGGGGRAGKTLILSKVYVFWLSGVYSGLIMGLLAGWLGFREHRAESNSFHLLAEPKHNESTSQ